MAGNIIEMGNNKYRLRYSQGFSNNGKRKYISETVYATSRRDAEKKMAELISRVEGGCTYSASKTTLNEFSKNNINLTKLHSRPRERNARETWEEIFFADVEANLDTPVMQNIMDNLKQLTGEIKVLGCYPSNEDHD